MSGSIILNNFDEEEHKIIYQVTRTDKVTSGSNEIEKTYLKCSNNLVIKFNKSWVKSSKTKKGKYLTSLSILLDNQFLFQAVKKIHILAAKALTGIEYDDFIEVPMDKNIFYPTDGGAPILNINLEEYKPTPTYTNDKKVLVHEANYGQLKGYELEGVIRFNIEKLYKSSNMENKSGGLTLKAYAIVVKPKEQKQKESFADLFDMM